MWPGLILVAAGWCMHVCMLYVTPPSRISTPQNTQMQGELRPFFFSGFWNSREPKWRPPLPFFRPLPPPVIFREVAPAMWLGATWRKIRGGGRGREELGTERCWRRCFFSSSFFFSSEIQIYAAKLSVFSTFSQTITISHPAGLPQAVSKGLGNGAQVNPRWSTYGSGFFMHVSLEF